MDPLSHATGSGSTRRRSQRVLAQVPILIRGVEDEHCPFQEETETLAINAHGALILLAASVDHGQKLVLRHKKTNEEQVCSVVYVGPAQGGKTEVGVEFIHPAPKFWRIAFPPEDWSPLHPDARPRSRS